MNLIADEDMNAAGHSAFIGLGSNLGDKAGNIRNAILNIQKNKDCAVLKYSSLYLTKPYGNPDQDNFLNAAIEISTTLDFDDLLSRLKKLESDLGRLRREKWGPREIDLDLLFFDDIIYSDDRITIPHPGIIKRDFVLIPLCEIAPGLIHPVLNKKICDICINDEEKSVIDKLDLPLFKEGELN